MKKNFSVFDGLFLMALYSKIVSGYDVSWFFVLLPYIFELFWMSCSFLFKAYGLEDRVQGWVAKKVADRAFKKSINKAKKRVLKN